MADAIDKLRFLADETIPDWSPVIPNQSLGKKVWLARNEGNTMWGAGYMLVHTGGNAMAAPDSVPLPPLAPNEEGRVVINAVTAPTTQGISRSRWTPRNANGQSFPSNLTIVVDVTTSPEAIPSASVSAIARELSAYGLVLVPRHWEDTTARRVRDVIVRAAQRLYTFAAQEQSPAILRSPEEVFRDFIPTRILRRNLDASKEFTWQDSQGMHIGQAFAWNDSVNITLYSNVVFTGIKKVTRQSPYARFAVTYTTEFLTLHELCHSHYLGPVFSETSQPLVDLVANVLLDHPHLRVESTTIASAGFRQAARSQNNISEFSADALANWFLESFTDAADEDTEGFGQFRREQIDVIVRKWLVAQYGAISP